MSSASNPDVWLFAGGHLKLDACCDRLWSPVWSLTSKKFHQNFKYRKILSIAENINVFLDSGAFSDKWDDRLSIESAFFDRQIPWLKSIQAVNPDFDVQFIASYDLLIDEVWVDGKRIKQRWTEDRAEKAVDITVDAAKFLSSQRNYLPNKTLVLGCQGVTARQYEKCVDRVLENASPNDWIGLGGWCILGWMRSWIPEFWETLYRCLPKICDAGIKHVHVYGVLYLPALGGLLWIADQYGITVSTDNRNVLIEDRWKDSANRKRRSFESSSLEYWQEKLSNLRSSEFYRQPQRPKRQLTLFDLGGWNIAS